MSLPNPFNPLKPSNPFNLSNEEYVTKSFLYVLCRIDDNMPLRAYENDTDIELFDSSQYKIVKVPLIKSFKFTSNPSKPEFVPYYVSEYNDDFRPNSF
jgi:hypothetical protein